MDEVYALIYADNDKIGMLPDIGNYVSIFKMVGKNLSATQWQFVTHMKASSHALGLIGDKIAFVKSPTSNDFYFGRTIVDSLL